MIKIQHITVIIAAIFLILGCTKDLDTINTNPNSPTEVQPEFLLRKVIYDIGEQLSYEGFVAGNLLGQYFTLIDFNLFDRHSLLEPQFGGNPWPMLYRNFRDNELILDKVAENPVFAVYEGPALVMKAYLTMNITDIFGDVPYSEAGKGKLGITQPAYDTQESIYLGPEGILATLDQAIASMNNYQGAIALKGDILYNGKLASWIKFANSLKLKALMRISGVHEVAVELKKLIQENNLITANTENATFGFTTSAPNNFRMVTARVGDFNVYVASETVMEILNDLDDPRRTKYFRPAEKTLQYVGLRNGPNASTTSISVSDYSLSGTIFRENSAGLKANFLTSWEVNFLIAEAITKGYISGNAKEYYDNGVRQAFDYWNTSMPADYLTNGNSAYDDGRALEQIITQKYLGNIINGFEGWIEQRRTGFPAFKPVQASLNNGLLPLRMPYPTDEAALNEVNYLKAASRYDGNSVNAKMWWMR